MNYLTLDLPNGNLVLSDNSVWKSLQTWLDGGTLYSDYYDASNKGDYWKASEHWINIDSSSNYLSFTIEYDFVNASATDSCLCQIKYDETIYGIAVTADLTGLNIQSIATVKHINCDYSNANIKIDVVANLLTKVITTYIHKNGIPLIKVVNDSSSYTFTEFVIQAGALGADIYTSYKLLPTTTKLLNVSVSDDDITYSDFTDTTNYVNKFGLSEVWTNTKNYISAQLLGKSDVGHTHTKSEITDFPTIPTKTSDLTNDSGFLTSHQDLSGYVPRSGGAVMTGNALSRAINYDEFRLDGGTTWNDGASLSLSGKNRANGNGHIILFVADGSNMKEMRLRPDGTWTWEGQAVQISSDQRLKQQISQIDDKLLDAWEDVELSQFKYNDAVNEKGNNARLHTGYVVQQIDEACKSHGVDVSDYGLYCHEEYPEKTEEVEVEQEDGTKTKERKVIREASEHYSLRYTEALIVECAYLRKKLKELTVRIEQLEKGNNTK